MVYEVPLPSDARTIAVDWIVQAGLALEFAVVPIIGHVRAVPATGDDNGRIVPCPPARLVFQVVEPIVPVRAASGMGEEVVDCAVVIVRGASEA